MPSFVAIIGSRNSGKSTIIKSLTGCKTAQFRGTVTDSCTGRCIEVIGASPQEMPLSNAALNRHLKNGLQPNFNGVVCALQPTNATSRPKFEDVLRTALQYGYTVHAFVLDPAHSTSTVPAITVNSRLPPGVLPLVQLDARRFAHLNAAIVHGYSSIAA